MSKKLPNIFKGKAPKDSNQTKTIINSNSEIKIEKNEKSINKQINDVFSSENFVYKADTIITLTSGDVIEKTIIGKTNNSLLTIDDELIEVSKIAKIELV